MNHRKHLAVYFAAVSLLGTGPAIATENPAQAISAIKLQLPGVIGRSIKQQELLRAPDGKGHESIVERTTRAPGTRTPLHMHEYGGTTCVLEGEMTLYMEGVQPRRAAAGECYYMPAGKAMAGVNSGTTNAIMHDMFVVPIGEPVWKVVEESGKSLQDQFTRHQH